MSKEQSLEYRLHHILGTIQTDMLMEHVKIDKDNWLSQADEDSLEHAVKLILKAIDSRLPKEPNSDTTAHLEINQIDDWELGYTQALSDVRKELGL